MRCLCRKLSPCFRISWLATDYNAEIQVDSNPYYVHVYGVFVFDAQVKKCDRYQLFDFKAATVTQAPDAMGVFDGVCNKMFKEFDI